MYSSMASFYVAMYFMDWIHEAVSAALLECFEG